MTEYYSVQVMLIALLMMMIAFITINSGLVPLIEGLCAPILYFGFEIIGGLRSHLSLFFVLVASAHAYARSNCAKFTVGLPRG